MTEEFSIRFRAFEGYPNIVQWPAYSKSVLTIPKEHPRQGRVVRIMVNGVPQKFRCNEFGEIVVNLIPLEGAYIHVVCLVPKSHLKLPQDFQRVVPAPRPEYGLQRPIQPDPRGNQWLPA